MSILGANNYSKSRACQKKEPPKTPKTKPNTQSSWLEKRIKKQKKKKPEKPHLKHYKKRLTNNKIFTQKRLLGHTLCN